MNLFDKDDTSARLSPCGTYRYTLDRVWNMDRPHVTFLMFNPSTADATFNDPTIRRCIGFAKRWGYGRLTVLNLFALRSSDPRQIDLADDPVGPENDYWTFVTLRNSSALICAWGCEEHLRNSRNRGRVAYVVRFAKHIKTLRTIQCLGLTKGGTPRHPLMLSYDTPREEFGGARHDATTDSSTTSDGADNSGGSLLRGSAAQRITVDPA
jgi:hypothetical protein